MNKKAKQKAKKKSVRSASADPFLEFDPNSLFSINKSHFNFITSNSGYITLRSKLDQDFDGFKKNLEFSFHSNLKKEILIPINDIHDEIELKSLLSEYAPLNTTLKRKRQIVHKLTREDKR